MFEGMPKEVTQICNEAQEKIMTPLLTGKRINLKAIVLYSKNMR
jgi:hypothetical protein